MTTIVYAIVDVGLGNQLFYKGKRRGLQLGERVPNGECRARRVGDKERRANG